MPHPHPDTSSAVVALRAPGVLTLPGQDHGAFWAAPEPVAEQIRAFLLS